MNVIVKKGKKSFEFIHFHIPFNGPLVTKEINKNVFCGR